MQNNTEIFDISYLETIPFEVCYDLFSFFDNETIFTIRELSKNLKSKVDVYLTEEFKNKLIKNKNLFNDTYVQLVLKILNSLMPIYFNSSNDRICLIKANIEEFAAAYIWQFIIFKKSLQLEELKQYYNNCQNICRRIKELNDEIESAEFKIRPHLKGTSFLSEDYFDKKIELDLSYWIIEDCSFEACGDLIKVNKETKFLGKIDVYYNSLKNFLNIISNNVSYPETEWDLHYYDIYDYENDDWQVQPDSQRCAELKEELRAMTKLLTEHVKKKNSESLELIQENKILTGQLAQRLKSSSNNTFTTCEDGETLSSEIISDSDNLEITNLFLNENFKKIDAVLAKINGPSFDDKVTTPVQMKEELMLMAKLLFKCIKKQDIDYRLLVMRNKILKGQLAEVGEKSLNKNTTSCAVTKQSSAEISNCDDMSYSLETLPYEICCKFFSFFYQKDLLTSRVSKNLKIKVDKYLIPEIKKINLALDKANNPLNYGDVKLFLTALNLSHPSYFNFSNGYIPLIKESIEKFAAAYVEQFNSMLQMPLEISTQYYVNCQDICLRIKKLNDGINSAEFKIRPHLKDTIFQVKEEYKQDIKLNFSYWTIENCVFDHGIVTLETNVETKFTGKVQVSEQCLINFVNIMSNKVSYPETVWNFKISDNEDENSFEDYFDVKAAFKKDLILMAQSFFNYIQKRNIENRELMQENILQKDRLMQMQKNKNDKTISCIQMQTLSAELIEKHNLEAIDTSLIENIKKIREALDQAGAPSYSEIGKLFVNMLTLLTPDYLNFSNNNISYIKKYIENFAAIYICYFNKRIRENETSIFYTTCQDICLQIKNLNNKIISSKLKIRPHLKDCTLHKSTNNVDITELDFSYWIIENCLFDDKKIIIKLNEETKFLGKIDIWPDSLGNFSNIIVTNNFSYLETDWIFSDDNEYDFNEDHSKSAKLVKQLMSLAKLYFDCVQKKDIEYRALLQENKTLKVMLAKIKASSSNNNATSSAVVKSSSTEVSNCYNENNLMLAKIKASPSDNNATSSAVVKRSSAEVTNCNNENNNDDDNLHKRSKKIG